MPAPALRRRAALGLEEPEPHPGASTVLRSTRRRGSALASLLVEELRRGAGGHHRTEGRIEVGAIGHSQPGPSLPDGLEQRGGGEGDAWARLTRFRDHLPTG